MRDPFPFKAIPVATQIKDFLTESLNLPTLPAHLHEVFFFVIFYHVVCTYISPFLSARIFPRVYPSLPRRTKLNWDVHVVSLVQSVYICSLAIWVINYDDERDAMKNDYRDRIWGYTGALGLVEASATGYFAWDLIMTSANIRIFGWGTLAHAIAASFAYGMGYRPFVNYYAPIFILEEISSPFLNFHWFFDKLDMTGSTPQFINGIALMTTFFGSRLVWGTYYSYRVFGDISRAYQYQGTAAGKTWLATASAASKVIVVNTSNLDMRTMVTQLEVWKYVRAGQAIPLWMAGLYLASNTVLTLLNIFWFNQMVTTIRKRFPPPFGTKVPDVSKPEKEKIVGSEATTAATTSIEISEKDVKPRKTPRRKA